MSKRLFKKEITIILILLFLALFLFVLLVNSYYAYKYPIKYKSEIIKYSEEFNIDSALVASVINAESKFDKNAISKKDFLAKLFISQKECAETQYWLELLMLTEYISKEQYESINNDCTEIIKLLVSTTKKLKQGTVRS